MCRCVFAKELDHLRVECRDVRRLPSFLLYTSFRFVGIVMLFEVHDRHISSFFRKEEGGRPTDATIGAVMSATLPFSLPAAGWDSSLERGFGDMADSSPGFGCCCAGNDCFSSDIVVSRSQIAGRAVRPELCRIFDTVTKAIWILLLAVLISPAVSRAQQSEDVHAAGSNLLRVGAGSTQSGSHELDKHYFEEIANARLFFQYFSIGLRYEMDDPSEVGRSYQDRNFRKRWITYRKDQLELQAGDVSALFGRGLALNLFESRALNYDSWLDGAFGKSEYKIPKSVLDAGASIQVQGIGGREDFYPIPKTTDTSSPAIQHISARAANLEFGLFNKKLLLGSAFVQAFSSEDQKTLYTTTYNRQVNQPDFYLNWNAGEVEAFAEWTEQRTLAHIVDLLSPLDTSQIGHAFYGSLSYSNPNFGLTFEYKNYQYYRHSEDQQLPGALSATAAFSKLALASPPEVYRDFTYTTITRTNHAVDFDDEVGAELEATITAIPNVTINLNGSASSRHDKYGDSAKVLESTEYLPKTKDLAFYPFWETFGEVEWEFDPATDLNYARIAFHRRSDVIAYAAAGSDYRSSTTLAYKMQYETTPTQSFLLILEHQWAYDIAAIPNHDRLNDMVTVQYSFNPTYTFGFIFDHTNGSDPGGADLSPTLGFFDGFNHDLSHWKNQAFVSLRLGGSHTLLTSYGVERGGVNCTGGICRTVPPFKGLRLTLTSQI